jgi:hypothetical protein
VLKVSTTNPWFANIVNYIVAGYIPTGPIRERLSDIEEYIFGMILTYIGCVPMVYSEDICHLLRQGRYLSIVI